MIRFLFKFIVCVLLALAVGSVYLAVRSGDPIYTFYEWISPARFQRYDELIRSVATEHHLDPMLVKAVVWRESRFDPKKYGGAGERGLMQVSEKAANEWARENKVDNFRVEKLFDPKTNLEAEIVDLVFACPFIGRFFAHLHEPALAGAAVFFGIKAAFAPNDRFH